MKSLNINNVNYEVVNDEKNIIDLPLLNEMITDYYKDFDYIVGDYAYGKLRLKGFNNKNSKSYKPINDIALLDDYIRNYCAYNCSWFCIKKSK